MADSEPNVDDVFDFERIQQLIELMKEHGLSEIYLRQSEQQIRLCRATTPAPFVPPQMPPPLPVVAPQVPPAAAGPPPKPAEEDDSIVYIKSPMVGTFYSRPNPNTEAYVKVGDDVAEETTVCIIEAMKVFNEIPAEVNGRILAVLAEDEEPVDFGKPLYKVDTSGHV